MSTPKEYHSLIGEIQKVAETEPWTEETVRLVLNCCLNGGLVAVADAHNRAAAFQQKAALQAQAVIAEVIELVKPWQEEKTWFYSNSVNQKIHELLKSIDPSALDKHDAKVRREALNEGLLGAFKSNNEHWNEGWELCWRDKVKPLVDALEQVQNDLAEFKTRYPEVAFFELTEAQITHALAKVKEGK